MAVKINGEPLPEQAIEFEYRRLLQFYSEHMPPSEIKEQASLLRDRAKQQAIGAKLLINEAHRLDFHVEAKMIDDKLENMIEGMGGRETFDTQLAKQGATEEMVRNSMVEGCKVDLLVERICEGTSDPTEAELKAHFDAHAPDYTKPDRVQAQHILINPDSDSNADKVTAKSKLTEIRAKVEEGGRFEEQASVHSDCPSGKQTGGSLGWFSRGMMVPEFDAAVFSMEVGQLSEIIETQFGFHIIQKTGEESGGEVSFVEARDKVRDFLRHSARGKAISAYVNELREKAVVEEA